MSARLEVVLVDQGPQFHDTAAGATAADFPPGPRARPAEEQVSRSGPRAREQASDPASSDQPRQRTSGPRADRRSEEVLDGLKRAATTAADAVGAGGLTRQAISLAEAFHRLWLAITGSAATSAAQSAAEASRFTASKPTGPKAGPRASAPDGVIDAEFEVKGPRPGLVPQGPPAGGDDGEGGGLIRLPNLPSLQQAKTRVETVSVSGPKPAPPVAGAAAGGSGAAAMMGRLAAAAGPAAIAIGALTAAAAIGAAYFRKTVEELDRLRDLSPELSAASSRNDIRAELADLRRAQRIGPTGAIVQDLRGQAMEQIADLLTEIYQGMTDFIANHREGLQLILNSTRVGVDLAAVIAARMEEIQDRLMLRLAELKKDEERTRKAQENLNKSFQKWLDINAPDPFGALDPGFSTLFPQLGLTVPPPSPPPAPAAPARRGGRARP
jgi:hypothetical protein